MDYAGPPQNFFTALYILVPLAMVALALYRGERARSQQAEERTRVWTRRAYRCFLTLGVLGILMAAVFLGIAKLSSTEQQGWGMCAGLFGGVPAAIAFLVGTFHALMVWRATLIRVLLLATVIVLSCFFADEIHSTPLLVAPWDNVVVIAYCLLVIAVSARGIRGLRTSATS
jgi:hypothetical protein